MGVDCIISGIRPQIAQTMVHLQIDLSTVTTKATMADALRVALKRKRLCFYPPEQVVRRHQVCRLAHGPDSNSSDGSVSPRADSGRYARPIGNDAAGRSDEPDHEVQGERGAHRYLVAGRGGFVHRPHAGEYLFHGQWCWAHRPWWWACSPPWRSRWWSSAWSSPECSPPWMWKKAWPCWRGDLHAAEELGKTR